MKYFFFCFLTGVFFCAFIFVRPVFAVSDIVIAEIMIGEEGAPDNEYIKLFNNSEADVVLDGFALKKKTQSGAESSLVSASKFLGTIKARGFFTIANPSYENFASDLTYSGSTYYISANNTILLYDAEGNLLDKAGFGEASDFENLSAAGIEAGQVLTRKFVNNQSIDTDNNSLDFELKMAIAEEVQEEIIETPAGGGSSAIENNQSEIFKSGQNKNIIISEIYPDPEGLDMEREFIELYNKGEAVVDLTGWRLGDNSGYEYEIKNSLIPGKGFFVLYRKESRIALNNSGDEAKLFAPLEVKPVQIVKYGNSAKGESFNLHKNKYVWNKVITPGRDNKINFAPLPDFYFPPNIATGTPIIFDSSDTFDENGDELDYAWDFGDGFASELANPEHTFWEGGSYKVKLAVSDGLEQGVIEKMIQVGNEAKEKELPKNDPRKVAAQPRGESRKVADKPEEIIELQKDAESNENFDIFTDQSSPEVHMLDLSQVKNLEPGDFAVTSGIVAALPGQLGSQYFYIVDEEGNGVQIYNNKKDFPELKIGDYIEVGGEISKINGMETRIKTRANDDMEVMIFAGEPEPVEIATGELDNAIGSLVKISGEILEKNGSSIYIDDGFGEALIYLRSGMDSKILKTGDRIEVIGIAGSAKAGARILPRFDADILKIEDDIVAEGDIIFKEAQANNGELVIPARDRRSEFWKYFITVLVSGLIIGGVLWGRWRRS